MKQYVLSHVDFTWPIDHLGDEDTIVLTEKDIKTNLKNIRKIMGINDPYYGELNAWKYIYDDIDDNEWAVLHHYRRKADQLYENHYNIPQMYFRTSVCEQTAYYHTRTMVDLLRQVLSPGDFSVLEGNEFIPYNIFLTDRPMLKSWLDYVNGKISAIKKIIGPLDKFLLNDRDLWVVRPGKNMEYDYQKRFFAFVLERLNTVWWLGQVINGVTVYPTHINKMNTNI